MPRPPEPPPPTPLRSAPAPTHLQRGLALLAAVCLPLLGPLPGHAGEDFDGAAGLADSAALRATVFGVPPEDRAPLPASVPLREMDVAIEGALPVPDIYWFNRKLRVYFSAQRGPAPLAIVIAGTGGSANGDNQRTLRGALYGAGYHVLTLPSPTFPGFIVAASSTGVAGDLRQDGQDLYRAIRQIVGQLRDRHTFTDINVLGYSLGAANAAMLKAIDDDHRSRGGTPGDALGIRRAVLINPPVSLFSSITRLDRLLTLSIGEDEADFERFYHELYGDLARVYAESDALTADFDFLFGATAQLLDTDRSLASAISLSFRLSLANLFFAGDLYARSGVVIDPAQPPGPGDSLGDVTRRLRSMPFAAYFDRVFAPFYLARRPGATPESLIADNHLGIIGERLRNDPDYYAQTNGDELILDRAELDWLRGVFGTRIVVYEHGGHLGNLGDKRQIEDMLRMVSGHHAGGTQ